MVIEAGMVAGYVIAWAMRKARRAGGRLDAETDEAIDAGLNRLHEVVVAKLGGHPALQDLTDEAEDSASGAGQVSELTRQQVELALTAAARKDEMFAQTVMMLVTGLREAERAGGSVTAGGGPVVFVGDAHVRAEDGGIAFGQVAGNVHVVRDQADPLGPGRLSR